jgi:hypothetical protein
VPAARGNGYFPKCVTLLRSAMGENDLFFGFPNRTSAPGLAKVGWQSKGIVTTWINALPLVTRRRARDILEIPEFDVRQDDLSRRLSARPHVMTSRSAAYLNWRYRRHPVHRYSLFALAQGDRHDGFMILRVAEVMGRRMTLVMELWAPSSRAEALLLRHAASWAVEHGTRLMAVFDTSLPLSTGLRCGFVPVPHRFLPKTQVLMAQPMPGRLAQEFMAADWRVQMGDWDVF